MQISCSCLPGNHTPKCPFYTNNIPNTYSPYQPLNPSTSWQCHLCKTVYAPSVTSCACAKTNATVTVLTNTPTTLMTNQTEPNNGDVTDPFMIREQNKK